MGFYVSVEPATDDLLVGNPQLGLSDVESYDTRAEYVFGDHGDLVARERFYKKIEDPIESIVVRNPLNFDGASNALFRTFFNNENEATVQGIEVEARKSLDFLGVRSSASTSRSAATTPTSTPRWTAPSSRSSARSGLLREAPGDAEPFSRLDQAAGGCSASRSGSSTPTSASTIPTGARRRRSRCFGISDVLDAAGISVSARTARSLASRWTATSILLAAGSDPQPEGRSTSCAAT